jgi:hypothetical protein
VAGVLTTGGSGQKREETAMVRSESGKRAWRRTCLAALAAAALLAMAPVASADEIVRLKAELAGANEVPPSGSPGTGHADVAYDKTTRTLTWTITYSGLESQVIMVHFHGPASPGDHTAPIQIWIASGTGVQSPLHNWTLIAPYQEQDLLSGRWFIRIHTTTYPQGALRGQLTVVP